jgi:hypothetical protein
LGKALAIARRDVVHPGHPLLPEVSLGALDPDWMPIVAAKGLVVISRDRRIRTRPAEVAAYRAAKLRAFWVAGKKDLSTWDNLRRVMKWWDDMEEVVTSKRPGPWFFALNETTVREVVV